MRFADLPLGPCKQYLVVLEQKDSGFCGVLSPGAWISAGMKVTAGGMGDHLPLLHPHPEPLGILL